MLYQACFFIASFLCITPPLFADRSFDLVHQRLLALAIPAAQWPGVLKELVRVTRPGGYVELLEGEDVFVNAGPGLQRFLSWWREASRARGFDTALLTQLESLLLGLRLHRITARTLEVPVGKWGGRTGELLEKNMLVGFPGLKYDISSLPPFPLAKRIITQTNLTERGVPCIMF